MPMLTVAPILVIKGHSLDFDRYSKTQQAEVHCTLAASPIFPQEPQPDKREPAASVTFFPLHIKKEKFFSWSCKFIETQFGEY